MTNQKPISLILLVHQEADVIERVIEDFYTKVTSKIPDSEFIVCEDGSTDGTKEILLRIENKFHLTLHMGNEKRGYSTAMKEAFLLAHNPIIFFSDSDGQHDPNDFWKLLPMMEHADIVMGWKKNRKDGLFRLLLTRVFNIITWFIFGVRVHDIDCGFRLLRKETVNFLLSQPWRLSHCIAAELTVKAYRRGFRIAEVPVAHFPREFGGSRGLPTKKLPKIIVHILSDLWKVEKDIRAFKKHET